MSVAIELKEIQGLIYPILIPPSFSFLIHLQVNASFHSYAYIPIKCVQGKSRKTLPEFPACFDPDPLVKLLTKDPAD